MMIWHTEPVTDKDKLLEYAARTERKRREKIHEDYRSREENVEEVAPSIYGNDTIPRSALNLEETYDIVEDGDRLRVVAHTETTGTTEDIMNRLRQSLMERAEDSSTDPIPVSTHTSPSPQRHETATDDDAVWTS